MPWEYGGFSIEAMDGHGGWIATARDLVRLLVAVDGFATKPDILTPETIDVMTTPSNATNYYAKGWSVNAANNWWHSGAVDGTASYYVRSNNGYTWAIVLNKRVVDGNANNFWNALDGLGWNCIASTTTFPTHDLFEAPTVNASNLEAINITGSSVDLLWNNGDGTSRILVAKALQENNNSDTQYFNAYPLDGTDYTANNTMFLGDDLGDGSFVIYNGTGNSVTLNGLSEDSQYAIRIYEYTKNAVNGNNALYLLGNANELVVSTEVLGLTNNQFGSSVQIFPNPSRDNITLKNNSAYKLDSVVIMDINGRIINTIDVRTMKSEKNIALKNYASGLYFIKISSQEGTVVKQLKR